MFSTGLFLNTGSPVGVLRSDSFMVWAELEKVKVKEWALKLTLTSGSSLDLFASCPT